MARRRTSKDVILSLVADDDQVLIDMSAMELAAEEIKADIGRWSIVRNYHYCEACKHGFYPRDRMLGLPEDGELTAEMEKRVVDFALNDTDASAAKRFSMHYGRSVSANLMRRVSERVGMRLEACRPEALAQALTPESARPAKVLTVFRILLAAELKAARATRAEQVVWLGDGAARKLDTCEQSVSRSDPNSRLVSRHRERHAPGQHRV